MLTVTCIDCRRDVDADGLDEFAGLAVCRVCKAVVDVPSADPRAASGAASDDFLDRESHGRISTPPAFSVSFTGIDPQERRESRTYGLVMSWPQEDASLGGLVWIFPSLVSWFGVYVAYASWKGGELGVLALSIFIAVTPALAFTYPLVVSLFNRTQLTIVDNVLRVRHAPLPWPGNHAVAANDIREIGCSKVTSTRHNVVICYTLNAQMRSGDTRPLVARLKHAETAAYLKQCIDEFLRLS